MADPHVEYSKRLETQLKTISVNERLHLRVGNCKLAIAVVALVLAWLSLSVSWESHAAELNLMRDRINTVGESIKKLKSLRSSASPWQQEAIDRTIPLAERIASNTQAAIEHLNKNPQKLHDPQYQQYLKSNAEVAANLAALVRDFVEYGKTKTTLEALERRLEVTR